MYRIQVPGFRGLWIAQVAIVAILVSVPTVRALGQVPTTGLYAWYEANQGVVVNGSNVVQSWADQSGNGNNLQYASGSPTLDPTDFNGMPSISFTGINSDSLRSVNTFTAGLGSSSPALTVFAVFTDTSSAGTESHAIIFGTQAPLASVMLGKVSGVAGMITGFGDNVDSTYSVATNGFSNIIESFRYEGGTTALNDPSTSLKVNGTEYLPGSGPSQPLNLTGSGYAWVGYSPGGQGTSATGLVGNVAELLVYNTVLSTSDENAVGYYLANKYGITSAYTAPIVSGSAWAGTTNKTWATAGNWTGSVAGSTSGTTSTDTLVFSTYNATNPAPVVDAGRNIQSIAFDNGAGGLTGSITLGTTTGNALLLTSGGTISTNFSVTNPQTINAPLVLEGSADTYTFTSAASSTTATLTFGGAITPGVTSGVTTLTLNGANAGSNTISGSLSDHGGGQLALTMGAGSWMLTGTDTYTGATTVNGGTLRVGNGTSGSLGNTPIMVGGGSLVLAGSAASTTVGITNGSLTLNSGGSLASPAISISGGSMTLLPGGTLGNATISLTGTGKFNVQPGSATISSGSTAAGTAGATLSLGSGTTFSMVDGAIGTFNLQQQASFGAANPALTLGGATLNFDLSSSGADKLAVNVGAVSASGTNTIGITPVGTSLTVGNTYTLISAPAGGLSGGTFQFSGGSTSKFVSAGTNSYLLTLHNSSTAQTVSVATAPTLPVTTNLYAWYDGTTGITTNTSNVVQTWSDKSGNGHDMLYNGGSPTYAPTGFNGLPAVQFTNINSDSLISSNFTSGLSGSHDMTVFAVFTDTSSANAESHALLFGTQSPSYGAMMLGKVGGVAGVPTGYGNDLHSTYSVATNGFSNIIESFRYTGGSALNSSPPSVSLKIDGTEYLPGSGSTSGMLNIGASNSAWIGYSSGISATGLVGDVAEIIVYNGVLADSQENAVGYYLAQKYGLTSTYTPPLAVGSTWTGATNTTWSTAGNWNGAVPGVAGATAGNASSTDTATFDTFDATNPAPVVDSGRNLQNISFDNTAGGLTGPLTLGTTTGNALLMTSGGLIQTDFAVTNSQTINAPLVLTGTNGTFMFSSNASATAATLNFGGSITAGASSGTTTLTLAGANTGANTISGALANGSGGATLAVTVQGGSWVLAAANTFTGATTISGGSLRVGNGTSGSLGATPISISAGNLTLLPGGSIGNTSISLTGGAFLVQPGSGTLSAGTTTAGTAGATLALNGGTFSMVDGAIGTFNLQQQASFGAANTALTLNGATLNFELSSSGADKLAVNVGAASVSGTNNIGITAIGSTLTNGATYTLISAPAGGLNGGTFQFAGGASSKIVSTSNGLYQLTLNTTSTAQTVTVAAAPSPPVTTNLYAWYSASLGVTTDGSGNVLSWSDLSGHGNDMFAYQGTVTYNPTGLNGQPSVHFTTPGYGSSGDALRTSRVETVHRRLDRHEQRRWHHLAGLDGVCRV